MLDVQSIEPDSIWVRTNPVWCYHEFRSRLNELDSRNLQARLADWINHAQDLGVRFPTKLWGGFFCHIPEPEWIEPVVEPRIVGLLCATGGNLREPEGFVTQVRAERSRCVWSVSDGLPFKVGHIQDALMKLLHASCVSLDSVIPEACPFEISDSLGQSTHGSSMNIAGLLAVIDAWNEYQGVDEDLLRCACSLVKPSGEDLVKVGSIPQKLDAFEREYGKGSLVICTGAISKQFNLSERFDCVWSVKHFGDLADRLGNAGLLEPLLRKHCLTTLCVANAGQYLERLRSKEGTKAALDFSYRLNRAAKEGGVESLRVQQRVNEALEDFNRHIGNSKEAAKYSQKAVETLDKLGEDVSFQEVVEAKSRLAAALYDSHQFPEAIDLLEELVDDAQENPRLLCAESRVILFNTYARLLVANGADGWETLYRGSIHLQESVDPSNIGRTRCYLIHGLLRNDRTTEAQAELHWFDENDIDSNTDTFVKYYRADLYRRNPDCGAKFRQDDHFESEGRGHAFGFYLQATARQPDRSSDERVERLRRTARVFRDEIGEYTDQNILHLFALFLELASRPSNGPAIRQEIEKFFDMDHSGKFREWYSSAIEQCPEDCELLLDRVPCF